MLLTGGHPSKIYHYDESLPKQADKLLKRAISYMTYLLTTKNSGMKFHKKNDDDMSVFSDIDGKVGKLIEEGYYRHVILELFSVVPKKHQSLTPNSASLMFYVYKKYINILLPSLMDSFDY